jgi:hypothetical protein
VSLCKGCGKEILWGETAEGRKVPLDPRVPVYSVIDTQDRVHGGKKTEIVRTSLAYAGHLPMCPNAHEVAKKEPHVRYTENRRS